MNNVEQIKSEIERQISLTDNSTKTVLQGLIDFIDNIKEEVPEHGYFETTYKRGKKPRWKVGDILAFYEFYSDIEGECIIGKVTDVKFDEEFDDWFYTFEDGSEEGEKSLIRDETYKKN